MVCHFFPAYDLEAFLDLTPEQTTMLLERLPFILAPGYNEQFFKFPARPSREELKREADRVGVRLPEEGGRNG